MSWTTEVTRSDGMPLPDALKLFAERIPVLDARFFVTAVLIQRESGGNLSEVLGAAGPRNEVRVGHVRQQQGLAGAQHPDEQVVGGLEPVGPAARKSGSRESPRGA